MSNPEKVVTEFVPGEQLQSWFSRHHEATSDDMPYKTARADQVMFVREKLLSVVAAGLDHERGRNLIEVIGEHTSKSVRLPVYSITRDDLALRLVLRDNFYNWKLSVASARPIRADFDGLFLTTPPIDPDYTGNPLSPVYFEGFPPKLIYGYYSESPKYWSAELWSDERLYTTLFLIMRELGAVKALEWRRRPVES